MLCVLVTSSATMLDEEILRFCGMEEALMNHGSELAPCLRSSKQRWGTLAESRLFTAER